MGLAAGFCNQLDLPTASASFLYPGILRKAIGYGLLHRTGPAACPSTVTEVLVNPIFFSKYTLQYT